MGGIKGRLENDLRTAGDENANTPKWKVTECGGQGFDKTRLNASTLTLIQTVDDDDEWRGIQHESVRAYLTERFDDELSELDVNGLFEDKWVVIDCRSNELARGRDC